MDIIFQEEKNKLDEIENKIKSIVQKHKKQALDLDDKIQDFHCYDYDDVEQLKYLRDCYKSEMDIVKQYNSYIDTPYFARLDLEHDTDIKTYYIGNEAIMDTPELIVADWRSPIGSCYYASNQKQFDINGDVLFLMLRRSLNISKGKLIAYKTEYDGTTVSLSGDVIDPFLLTVLQDKRRQRRLTDIIRSIQENQNKIIRLPLDACFVVQGCAGSGKTMILLHRLSYLLFNNKHLKPDAIKIITPNKYFDMHINDLSNKLGLNAIERLSVEEYYVRLIKKFSSNVSVSSNVSSEKTVNEDLLREIYSISYRNSIISEYNSFFKSVISKVYGDRIIKLLNSYNLSFRHNNSTHTADDVSSLYNTLKQLLKNVNQKIIDYDAISTRITTINSNISDLNNQLDENLVSLDNIKKQTYDRLSLEIESFEDVYKKIIAENTLMEEHKQRSISSIKNLEREYSEKLKSIQSIKNNSLKYSSYEFLTETSDKLSNHIKNKYRDIFSAIYLNEETYKKTPLFNFGKRNSLRKKSDELKTALTKICSSEIRQYIANEDKHNQALNDEIYKLVNSVKAINEKINNNTDIIDQIYIKKEVYSELIKTLESQKIPDVSSFINLDDIDMSFLNYINNLSNNHYSISRKIFSHHTTKKELTRQLEEIGSIIALKSDESYIKNCIESIGQLQFDNIRKNVLIKSLTETYKKYNVLYKKTNYRHMLYLNLLLCSLYFKRPYNLEKYINIDEAQDISYAEYTLLHDILGQQCVFNLYGDIFQGVYTYKGIKDWKEISNIIQNNIYVLNENYRNTLQITEFCNKEFNTNVYPIGIRGEPVQELCTIEAIQQLIMLKKSNPDYRTAIIYRYGLKEIPDILHKELSEDLVSWLDIDDDKISIVSVEAAKGLEFDAVVVFTHSMSENEKYISYTRALEQLIVVRDVYSNELIDDNSVPTDEEESLNTANDNLHKYQDLVDTLETVMYINYGKSSSEVRYIESRKRLLELKYVFSNLLNTCRNKLKPPVKDYNMEERCKKCNSYYNNACHNESCLLDNYDEWGDPIPSDVYCMDGNTLYKYLEIKRARIESASVIGTLFDNNTNRTIVDYVDIDITSEEYSVLENFNNMLEERFGSEHILDNEQKQVVCSLLRKNNTIYTSSVASMKSIIINLLSHKAYSDEYKQTIITADLQLQENVLSLSEKLGLKVTTISTSMQTFIYDVKKSKYQIIFIPYSFFENGDNRKEFLSYFAGKIAYWAIDHPSFDNVFWNILISTRDKLGATMYVMTKDHFALADNGFFRIVGKHRPHSVDSKKYVLNNDDDKINWLISNLDLLTGQGIIYCNDSNKCKIISKQLRKKKLLAEAYVETDIVINNEKIHYITNGFSTGSIPIIVTTHAFASNISNPAIRFIVHYDIPEDDQLYNKHCMQIGKLAELPEIYDLMTTSS